MSANHMDQSDETIKESMQMTNIMPQTSILNQQAWLRAEDIFECYRDLTDLNTIVGIIMGNDTSNDIFVKSHGVRTPDFYWRIIEKKNGEVIAWIMVIVIQSHCDFKFFLGEKKLMFVCLFCSLKPNDNTARKTNLDRYLVKISEIERRTGFTFTGFSWSQKIKLPKVSWSIPKNCKKSR